MAVVDLLVIGWGKADKTLAADAAGRGLRVAVVERSAEMVGGSCINVACVPTKILVHEAQLDHDPDDGAAAFVAAVERRDTLTGTMRAKNFDALDSLDGVLLVQGHARFTGEREVLVTGGDEELHLSAETVVVNTGTRPAVPDIQGARVGGRIHDSESIQHVEPRPRSLVVVGGGYVGLELASVFAKFGSRVTVLDRGERPLRHEDPDVAETAAAILHDDGVRLVPRAVVTRVDDDGDRARVAFEVDGGAQSIEADVVLLALGRTPVTGELGLAAAGVDTDERGYVVVDDRLRTSAPGVFAVGDVNGGPQFTYVSLDDYRVVADQLFGSGERSTADRVAVPTTTFLTPPLARVGLTQTRALERGLDVRVAVAKVGGLRASPRFAIEDDKRGIVKIVVDAGTDLVLGAALQHRHAHEVVNVLALAMRHGVTATQLRDSIYTHPSATEMLNEVLGALR